MKLRYKPKTNKMIKRGGAPPEQIKKVSEATGCSLRDAKKALNSNGSIESAMKQLISQKKCHPELTIEDAIEIYSGRPAAYSKKTKKSSTKSNPKLKEATQKGTDQEGLHAPSSQSGSTGLSQTLRDRLVYDTKTGRPIGRWNAGKKETERFGGITGEYPNPPSRGIDDDQDAARAAQVAEADGGISAELQARQRQPVYDDLKASNPEYRERLEAAERRYADNAATVIQAGFRGMQDRAQVLHKLEAEVAEEERLALLRRQLDEVRDQIDDIDALEPRDDQVPSGRRGGTPPPRRIPPPMPPPSVDGAKGGGKRTKKKKNKKKRKSRQNKTRRKMRR